MAAVRLLKNMVVVWHPSDSDYGSQAHKQVHIGSRHCADQCTILYMDRELVLWLDHQTQCVPGSLLPEVMGLTPGSE